MPQTVGRGTHEITLPFTKHDDRVSIVDPVDGSKLEVNRMRRLFFLSLTAALIVLPNLASAAVVGASNPGNRPVSGSGSGIRLHIQGESQAIELESYSFCSAGAG